MAERTELSEERMELIRRFMGEPEGEDAVPPARRPAAPVDPPSEARTVEQAPPRPARRRPVRPFARPPRLPRFESPAAFREGVVRLPGLVGSLRSRGELGWPLAAVVLGLVIGMLIARSV
jgi:hypothetical protein